MKKIISYFPLAATFGLLAIFASYLAMLAVVNSFGQTTNAPQLITPNGFTPTTNAPGTNIAAAGPVQFPIPLTVDPTNHTLNTAVNASTSITNVTDSTPYGYLRVSSSSPGLWGQSGIKFQFSADGHNFLPLSTNSVSWTDTNANAQCFTPSVLYYNSNFWTAYDVFATTGPNANTTNRTGLVRSPDLVNFTNIGPIILPTVVNVENWGQRWYMETNQPFITFASGWPGAKKCYISSPLDTNMATWSTPVLIVNSGSAGGAYDPCIVKQGSTYYCFVADGFINVYTNSSLTSQFSLYKANLFPSQTFSNILEGPCVVPTPTGWRMYLVGDPGNIAKGYYSESTGSLTNWSTPVEITESGDISDNGSVLPLSKAAANAVELAQLSKVSQDKIYDVFTTNTTPGVGITNLPPSEGVLNIEYFVTAIGSSGQVAQFHLQSLSTGDIIDGTDSLVGGVRTIDRVRPNSSWNCYPTNNSTGVYLQFIGPNSQTVRWHVHQRLETTILPPQFPGTSFDASAEPNYLLNPAFQSVTNTGTYYGNGSGLTNTSEMGPFNGFATTSIAATTTQEFINVTNSGAVTITMPTAASSKLSEWHIKLLSASASVVITNANGTDLFDNAKSITNSTQYKSTFIKSDGTNFWTY